MDMPLTTRNKRDHQVRGHSKSHPCTDEQVFLPTTKMFFSTIFVASVAALAAATPVKRGFGGRATFYETGLGACGEWNNDSDYIVALNSEQYGGGYPGPECFKKIQISANGQTATATIMDECPTCSYGQLDLSPSLFNHFANPDDGIFEMTWDYVN
ncbi:hypothetical protein QFC24_005274 [Naganishia onofrii]|uniref:Uncharacterized protein n=1 Tax=Naganishia onofrii TaxID=1851511 RepID=A0ACC2X9Q3_9TREE|nr:hypothetical protein QFC24_005274 [Naganishia onofrii]